MLQNVENLINDQHVYKQKIEICCIKGLLGCCYVNMTEECVTGFTWRRYEM